MGYIGPTSSSPNSIGKTELRFVCPHCRQHSLYAGAHAALGYGTEIHLNCTSSRCGKLVNVFIAGLVGDTSSERGQFLYYDVPASKAAMRFFIDQLEHCVMQPSAARPWVDMRRCSEADRE